jgi:hypothetical protein
VSSSELSCNIHDFTKSVNQATGKKLFQFDLRHCYANGEDFELLGAYQEKVKENLAISMAAG